MHIARTVVALAISLAAAGSASAATVWKVEGVFAARQVPSLVGFDAGKSAVAVTGGELSGTFTTDDQAGQMRVVAVNLTTTAKGAFRSFTYDDVDMIDAALWMPQYFRMSVPVPDEGTYELQLFFGPGLGTLPQASFGFTGYEHQDFPGSGNRMLTGVATYDHETGVPEPTTWALMIAGFGLAGTALRRRESSPSRA